MDKKTVFGEVKASHYVSKLDELTHGKLDESELASVVSHFMSVYGDKGVVSPTSPLHYKKSLSVLFDVLPHRVWLLASDLYDNRSDEFMEFDKRWYGRLLSSYCRMNGHGYRTKVTGKKRYIMIVKDLFL